MAAGRICIPAGRRRPGPHCRFLSAHSRRNSKEAAYRFLGKRPQQRVKKWQIRDSSTRDKAPAYGRALALLKREGRCPSDVEHRAD